jgi:hypothetical protein
MIKNIAVCLVVAIGLIVSVLSCQSAYAQTAEEVEAAKKETFNALKNSTLSERYYLFQLARVNKPNSGGVSQFSLDGGAKNYYAPALKEAARADGTYEPFGAVFDVLGSFGDAGSDSVPSAQSGIQTQLFGAIKWESEHFGYENTVSAEQVGYKRKVDFSFSGEFGLYPALVLENLTSTTTTIAQPNARPMFQDAFHWTIGPNLNFLQFSHGESTAFVSFGQNFLINEVTSYKQGDNTVTATPVSNGVGRAAAFVEGGLQTKILANPIWVAHDDKISHLSPLFLVASGVRRDTRFSASGDLAGYDRPEERLFFRFYINLTKVVSYTDETKPANPASVRFGVDLERPIFDQRVPTATRFFVSADLDIMKIFRPSTTGGTP